MDAGWKKAFASFTGHADITAFYTEFDAWAKTATENDILADLRSDADVVLQTNSTFDITTEDFLSEGIQAAETCDFQSAVSAAGVQSAVKLAGVGPAAILAIPRAAWRAKFVLDPRSRRTIAKAHPRLVRSLLA